MRGLILLLPLAMLGGPHVLRVMPLGGQAGTTVEVEFTGSDLEAVQEARFDSPDLAWVETVAATVKSVKGRIRIAPQAALGPHRVQLISRTGRSNSWLFNVNQFPNLLRTTGRQPITLKPQVIQGQMKGLADQHWFTFPAQTGERWLFDLQSIERGGFLECSLTLYDEAGREVAHNEDQDEFLETPRLAQVFARAGNYTLKIDQYRGPQGVACGENCVYQLQISQLPVVTGLYPLGARPGSRYSVHVSGEALAGTTGMVLVRARGAEHYRLTFPYTLPVDGSDTSPQRIEARRVKATAAGVDGEFELPATAQPGLWRLWLQTRTGWAEAITADISTGEAMDGQLLMGPGRHPVDLRAGEPFHAWTLAAQLGLPEIDTVLELWSADGKLLAEHDDLMSGQGTVIGNPDSSLFYLPQKSEKATLVVRDRTDRTGPTYAYRLHVRPQAPSFQLLAEPEELSAAAGTETEVTVLLIKEPGFEKAVDVWVEGHPEAKGNFRADQHFGPSGDGDNINIPAVKLKLKVPASAAAGDYPFQLRGRAADGAGGLVEGLSTLWIGPQGKRNDTRRPMPQPTVYVLPR